MTDFHSVNPQVPYNAKGIIYRPVPMLVEAPSKTVHPSLSRRKYRLEGKLTHWGTFEQEVRTFTSQILDSQASAISYDTFLFRDTECVVCATEQGVVGRFQQQVGHVVNNVARSLGRPYRLGDWHNTRHPKVIPDIAIWQTHQAGGMRTVAAGEAKTPWTVDEWPEDINPAIRNLDGEATLCVAQIGFYMEKYDLKYGFLTSYDRTYFFERRPSSQDPTSVVLAISNGIRFDQSSSDHTGAVSLRECMLGLMLLMEVNGWEMRKGNLKPVAVEDTSRAPPPTWHRANDGSKFNQSGPGGPSHGLGPGAGSSGGQQTQHSSRYGGSSTTYSTQGYSSRDLTADFNRLQVRPKQQRIDNRLEVWRDEKKNKWYWSDARRKDWYPVKKAEWYKTDQGEQLHFKIDGEYRPTKMFRRLT